jgi:hypothetical protein
MKIMPEFADILRSANDDEMLSDAPTDTEEVSDVPIVLDEMFANAKCAAALNMGSHGARLVHNLAVASAERSAPIRAHYKKLAASVAKKEPALAAGDDDDTLEKYFSPAGRRKASLREFLKGRLAEGDSAESVIAYAARYDVGTANILREIAAEFA